MKSISLLSLFLLLLVSCSKKEKIGPGVVVTAPPPTDKGWTFESTPLWSDEFDKNGLPDAAKWDYDLGGSGWGNNELQYYTNSANNAVVENGKLVITAKKESREGRNYTSARVVSRNKGDFLYGRFEIKAKLPAGRGTWPAIWMLPTEYSYGAWPKSGEIDIMEHVGYDLNKVHMTTHTHMYNHRLNTQQSGTRVVDGATTTFHLYRVDWTPYAIRGYIDDELVFQHINDGKGPGSWPFDIKFHLLLNVAVGGDWGGLQGVDDTAFPTAMEVDYVRVFKMIDK